MRSIMLLEISENTLMHGVSHNIIHGSDSLASAEREIGLFFGEDLV